MSDVKIYAMTIHPQGTVDGVVVSVDLLFFPSADQAGLARYANQACEHIVHRPREKVYRRHDVKNKDDRQQYLKSVIRRVVQFFHLLFNRS